MQPKKPTPQKPPDPPAVVWVGIDIAKLTVDAALAPLASSCPVATFPRTRDGLAALLAWARTHIPAPTALRALMEATGSYSLEAAAWLTELDPSLRPVIVNPLQAKRFAQSHGRRNKTDHDDARMLACFGAERSPQPRDDAAPRPVLRTLRALVHERRQLVLEKTRLKQRQSEGAAGVDFIARRRERRLLALGEEIAAYEEEIANVVEGDAQLRADVARLMTIPGVGMVTATTLLAELGDLRRFASGREIAAFAGVSPSRSESGTSVRGRTRMCKVGSPAVRAALFMAASTAARMKRGGLREMYERLRERGKRPKSAIGALMRKVLTIARALLVAGEDYKTPAAAAQTT